MARAIVLHTEDNVATLIDPGGAGTDVRLAGNGGGTVPLKGDVPYGHKFAIAPIAVGAEVRKYGQVIGRATSAIEQGEHVHVHNVESRRGRGDRPGGQ